VFLESTQDTSTKTEAILELKYPTEKTSTIPQNKTESGRKPWEPDPDHSSANKSPKIKKSRAQIHS